MEWKGINLTNYHQTQWLNRLKLLGFQYVIIFALLIVSMVFLIKYSSKLNKQLMLIEYKNQQIIQQINQKQNQLTLFHRQQHLKMNTINQKNIVFMLKKLQELPIKGAITELFITHNSHDNFQILGKLNNQKNFKKIMTYFKKLQDYKLSVDILQTNGNNELEFVFSLNPVTK